MPDGNFQSAKIYMVAIPAASCRVAIANDHLDSILQPLLSAAHCDKSAATTNTGIHMRQYNAPILVEDVAHLPQIKLAYVHIGVKPFLSYLGTNSCIVQCCDTKDVCLTKARHLTFRSSG